MRRGFVVLFFSALVTALGCSDGGSSGDGAVAGQVGSMLEEFSLPQCDGTPYSYYGEAGSSQLTVLSIAAGWCVPCIDETREMTERITEAYRAQGVRVVQVLVQDADFNTADQEDCDAWVDNFGLTNVELRDPDNAMQVYWPSGTLPATLIVDADGVVQFNEIGAQDGLTSLTTALDGLLSGM